MEFIKDQEKRILLSAISREEKVIKEHPELKELIPVIKQLDYYFMYDRLFKKIYNQGYTDCSKNLEEHDKQVKTDTIEEIENFIIDAFNRANPEEELSVSTTINIIVKLFNQLKEKKDIQ